MIIEKKGKSTVYKCGKKYENKKKKKDADFTASKINTEDKNNG